MKEMDKKAELIKKLQGERDRRDQVEQEVICLIAKCEFEAANELLKTINNDVVKAIEQELDQLSRREDG